jgi:hypothetical protein
MRELQLGIWLTMILRKGGRGADIGQMPRKLARFHFGKSYMLPTHDENIHFAIITNGSGHIEVPEHNGAGYRIFDILMIRSGIIT